MDEQELLAAQFEQHRAHLRAVAYRMLGSPAEADDAVQDTWVRFSRADPDGVDNLRAWLTTVVSRVSLNALRSRASRREDPLDPYVPDPVLSPAETHDPERAAVLADPVSMALLVILDALSPPERIAFVLHDLFAVPFDDIATLLDRSPAATRQLASRARRRVRGASATPAAELRRHRKVVEAFFAAATDGDLDRLVAVLHPDVVLRSDGGVTRPQASAVVVGAEVVAGRAMKFAGLAPYVRRALVNGRVGVVVVPKGRAVSVMAFTVSGDQIVAIDALTDPARLLHLDLSDLDLSDLDPSGPRYGGA